MRSLHALTKELGWEMRQIQLNLDDQWPLQRQRWFCTSVLAQWLPDQLLPWSHSKDYANIGSVIGTFLTLDSKGRSRNIT